MTVVVLDAGALIALERRDTRMLALADELYAARRTGYVPAGVVAQTWRGSARQHAMVRLLRAGAVRVDPPWSPTPSSRAGEGEWRSWSDPFGRSTPIRACQPSTLRSITNRDDALDETINSCGSQ